MCDNSFLTGGPICPKSSNFYRPRLGKFLCYAGMIEERWASDGVLARHWEEDTQNRQSCTCSKTKHATQKRQHRTDFCEKVSQHFFLSCKSTCRQNVYIVWTNRNTWDQKHACKKRTEKLKVSTNFGKILGLSSLQEKPVWHALHIDAFHWKLFPYLTSTKPSAHQSGLSVTLQSISNWCYIHNKNLYSVLSEL